MDSKQRCKWWQGSIQQLSTRRVCVLSGSKSTTLIQQKISCCVKWTYCHLNMTSVLNKWSHSFYHYHCLHVAAFQLLEHLVNFTMSYLLPHISNRLFNVVRKISIYSRTQIYYEKTVRASIRVSLSTRTLVCLHLCVQKICCPRHGNLTCE